MDFSLSAEQRELKAAAADFARRELDKDFAEREEAGKFSREAWRACAAFGIQALPVPAELGGGGADILTTVLVMEALGYGCHDNGLLFSLNAQLWSLEMPLVKFGTPAQQQAYLPGLMSGDLIGVHAMTEPDSGSDAFSMRTRAEREGDSYMLSGTKLYITNAPVADVLLVFAVHPGQPKLGAISAFLVEQGTPGCTVTRGLDKMGLRTSPMGEVVLDGCRVPAGNRLGPEGAGMAIFNSSMTWERSCIVASALGAMQRQLEACVAYARTRKQFGQSIGKFQAVADKVADMYLRLEAARLLVYQAAWLGQQGNPVLAEAAAAKLFTSEAWVTSSLDAVQVHGAYGYMKESGIERDLRDAVASTIYSGTSEIQRVILARMLGLLAPGRRGGEMAYLLQHLLADSAARAPRRPAVTAGGLFLSYAELDQLSNQVARALLAQGVAPGDPVGIFAPKSAASVVGLFGVLKAGACYVPLDPKSPAARLAAIMTDSGIAVVLADQATADQTAALAGRVPALRAVIVTGPHWGRETAGIPRRPSAGPAAPEPAAPEPAATEPPAAAMPATVPWEAVLAESAAALGEDSRTDTDLAYILYTSGSTGTPKGVMISHRASLTFVEWAAACTGLGEADRVCSPAPLHFDLSVFDVFATCAAGACLAVVPENLPIFPARLAQWLERERITVWYSVPSVLAMLATYGNLRRYDLSGLRAVIFAGEVFPVKHLARLMAELPGARYLNWYGPTETNVCTWYEVPPGSAELTTPVPIGKACANTDAFAVTSEGDRVVKPGEEGELYVRGSGLMRGYRGDQAETRRALVKNPFQAAYYEPTYRTGDLVTLDEAGNYVFLGRRDGMVKTRGYRVELGEVEAALYAHPAVREAVVLPVPDELLGSRLRAVIAAAGPGGLTREEVLDHCRRRLPGYMVPDTVEFCAALPRTSTGKVDRALLAAPDE